MKILFTHNSWEDCIRWQIEDVMVYQKIIRLLKEIKQSPYQGPGKPAALSFDLKGLWSRNIDREHRLVYQVLDDELLIYSCRYYRDK